MDVQLSGFVHRGGGGCSAPQPPLFSRFSEDASVFGFPPATRLHLRLRDRGSVPCCLMFQKAEGLSGHVVFWEDGSVSLFLCPSW